VIIRNREIRDLWSRISLPLLRLALRGLQTRRSLRSKRRVASCGLRPLDHPHHHRPIFRAEAGAAGRVQQLTSRTRAGRVHAALGREVERKRDIFDGVGSVFS
jgi:hypothetical protein